MALSTVERLAQAMADLLVEVAGARIEVPGVQSGIAPSWKEKLWSVDSNVRLGVRELAEALGRSKAYVYRLTRTAAIPHRKLDGALTFRVGDIREWLKDREDVMVTGGLRHVAADRAGPMMPSNLPVEESGEAELPAMESFGNLMRRYSASLMAGDSSLLDCIEQDLATDPDAPDVNSAERRAVERRRRYRQEQQQDGAR